MDDQQKSMLESLRSECARAPIVLVHGAWHGGWCWQRVATQLRQMGHPVYAPSLTGLADRSHLFSPEISLQTHVDDIANLIRWEGLDRVVLCGHSYGGMVITGVVEEHADKIRSLVYLDAVIPDANMSLMDYASPVAKTRYEALAREAGHGGMAPTPARTFMVNDQDQAYVDSKCTTHPYRTFFDMLPSVTKRDQVARKFALRASGYKSEMLSNFTRPRRGSPGWEVIDLPYGHDLMIDAPVEIAAILSRAARD